MQVVGGLLYCGLASQPCKIYPYYLCLFILWLDTSLLCQRFLSSDASWVADIWCRVCLVSYDCSLKLVVTFSPCYLFNTKLFGCQYVMTGSRTATRHFRWQTTWEIESMRRKVIMLFQNNDPKSGCKVVNWCPRWTNYKSKNVIYIITCI